MFKRGHWAVITGLVLMGWTQTGYANLNQQQFVESVGLLGLDPDTFAAAGVSEADLITAYQMISGSDAQWAAVAAQRDVLRAALDEIASDEQGDGMLAVEAAQASLAQTIASWRDTATASVPYAVQSKLVQMNSQSSSGLPAYLLVREWTPDELTMLSKGIADQRRQQRAGDAEESAALTFYLDAMSVGDVITAKANWDARKAVYTQRFTERMVTLD